MSPIVSRKGRHGFWIFIKDKKYFLPFIKYPWFKEAKISSITNAKLFLNHHLYWSDLDIDLSIEILNKPDNYPLTYK